MVLEKQSSIDIYTYIPLQNIIQKSWHTIQTYIRMNLFNLDQSIHMLKREDKIVVNEVN